MPTTVIIIPVHSDKPSAFELVSFQQCFNVLSAHSIVVVAPHSLSLSAYEQVVSNFAVKRIDTEWQNSLMAYNRMKMSKFFYNQFAEYDYLLTYELDAFVFRDEIDCWVSKAYDFIGAPWFDGFDKPADNAGLLGVGNSGFSLRNIKSVRMVLQEIYYRNPDDFNFGRKRKLLAYTKYPLNWLVNIFGENRTVQKSELLEDRFFCDVVPEVFESFKVAPVNEALKFSFEVQPEKMFEMNGRKLPMGCHAWWRYNLNFWRPYINAFGYSV